MIHLPIDSHIEQIVDHVRRSRAAVVTAAPGGKTTRVLPALMADGPVILLQPRRVAARAIAARIADERGWTLGREVGWQMRFERRFSAETRLLVVTEGVLTARLQTDPLLSGFATIVLDEFHERSVQADLAIAPILISRTLPGTSDTLPSRKPVKLGRQLAAGFADSGST